jgi:diguanylate cyclase (GGDEF)-like protein
MERPRVALPFERADSPHAVLIPYAACSVIALLMLPLSQPITWVEVGPALGLQLTVALLVAFAARLGVASWSPGGSVAIIIYLVSVALLRDGAGPSAGFGPLALLPVMWASLRGRRDELAVGAAGVALIYVAPALLIGPPQYQAGSWRAGLLFAVISAAIGIAVIQLVRRIHGLVEQLSRLARTDELTGLANRRGWQELLERELNLAVRISRPVTVALLDLDMFKDYNDTRGHLAGDRLLRATTSAWHHVLRDVDVLARWGGDEFAVLLPGCTAQQALGVLDRLRAVTPEVQFSAGIAQYQPGTSPQRLLITADEALYLAKDGERNSSVVGAA